MRGASSNCSEAHRPVLLLDYDPSIILYQLSPCIISCESPYCSSRRRNYVKGRSTMKQTRGSRTIMVSPYSHVRRQFHVITPFICPKLPEALRTHHSIPNSNSNVFNPGPLSCSLSPSKLSTPLSFRILNNTRDRCFQLLGPVCLSLSVDSDH